MIDELDQAFDRPMEKGRHRRGRRRRRGSGRGKTVLALLLTFLLLGGLGGGVWYGFDRISGFFVTPDYDGPGTGEVMIQVKSGETATDIGNTLVKADVVKSAKAFIDAADANSRSKNIMPGSYKMRLHMSGAAALNLLLDPKSRVNSGITIPEGYSYKQTFTLLSKKTKIPVKDFEAAAKDPEALGVPDWWFKRNDGKKVTKSIEGFLYPDTYEFPPDATAEIILQTMVTNFLTVTGKMKFADQVQNDLGGISPYEALVVASLAQAEAGNKDDLAKVARVAYNRVYKANMPLQFDVTINYGLELQGKKSKASKDLTKSELQDESNPYNMHVRRGLPPTPINSPGELALKGAMSPPKKNWLYFVAIDKEGHSAFADTYEEHLKNEQKAKENGVL